MKKFGNKSYVILGTDGEAPAGFVEGETYTVTIDKNVLESEISNFRLGDVH
mgnify:CR=1 FL=1